MIFIFIKIFIYNKPVTITATRYQDEAMAENNATRKLNMNIIIAAKDSHLIRTDTFSTIVTYDIRKNRMYVPLSSYDEKSVYNCLNNSLQNVDYEHLYMFCQISSFT